MIRKGILLFTVCAVVLCVSAAMADEQGEEEYTARSTAHVFVEHVGQADIEGSGASFSFTEYAAGFSRSFFSLHMNRRNYNWENGANLSGIPGETPWDSLTQIAPGIRYRREIDDQWGIMGHLIAVAGYEDEIGSNSWSYNPLVIAAYRPSEATAVYIGAGMLSHPTDTILYPILGINWNRDVRKGLSGSLGFPETMLSYRFNDELAIKADLKWDVRFYGLDEENAIAPEGYLKIEDIKPGLHFTYTPSADLAVDLGVTRYTNREFAFYGHDETKMNTHEMDDAWGVSLEVEYTF